MITQLDLTKNVLLKSFSEIMAGLGNKSLYELFNQQQKMVLEINSFIEKTISDIISDMNSAKVRWSERKREEDDKAIDIDSEVLGETIIVSDKTQFLKDIQNAVNNTESHETIDEEFIEERRNKMMDNVRTINKSK